MEQALLEFLDRSPTPWHAVDQAIALLKSHGFNELKEANPWTLKPGERYWIQRNGSSLAAFIVPKETLLSVHLIGTHTDSPGFRLKPNAEFIKENMVMLGLEVYGGPLIASWLNRDLGIAGRVVYLDKNGHKQEGLINLHQQPVVIPQLAIHLDRQVNETGPNLNKQEQLAALACLTSPQQSSPYLERLIQQQLPVKKILSTDLFLYPLELSRYIGDQKQLIASYRLDNLLSAYAGLQALFAQKPTANALQMVMLWDHEEVGSVSAQGAASPFFMHWLERITLALGLNREAFLQLLSQSLCVSADLTHAQHPNYSDKHEPRHQVLMEQGVVIKFNAQQRYASDARSAGVIAELADKHHIPLQKFVTRGDIPSGSTIGPIHAGNTGMPTVDIGIPQLSMHSCRELVAAKDYISLKTLLSQFLALNKFVC